MQPQQQEQLGTVRDAIGTANGLVNLFFICCTALAATVYPFLRVRFGSRYFGLIQLAGLPISWLIGVTTCLPDTIWPFTYFTYAYLVALFFQRISTGNALKNGYYHSRYNGYPLACRFIGVSESVAKSFVEPLFVSSLGVMVLILTQHSFGIFLIAAGIAILLDHAQIVDFHRRRAMEIRDQEILNQVIGRQLESMR